MELPSKKASLSILLIVTLSTIVFVSSSYFQKKNDEQNNNSKIVVKSNIENAETDFDGDGLLDWEELLWGTDPQKFDTDGDGTNDFEETKLGRDPLVNSPDDTKTNAEERILKQIEEDNKIDPNGLTNQVAVSLAENYFTLRGNGQLNDTTKQELIENIVQKTVKQINIKPVYTNLSLRTFNDMDPEKLKNYTDKFLKTKLGIMTKIVLNEENINYKEVGDYVMSQASQFVFTEVPTAISQQHLKLSNNLYNIGKITKEFEKESTDPLYVLVLIRYYENLLQEVQDINRQIEEFLIASGIIIEGTEIKVQGE